MTFPPHIFAYRDRHGRIRYRFRARGLPTRSIPGQPGEPRFEAAYAEARRGEPNRRGKDVPRPRTLAGAWNEVRRSVDWTRLKPISQKTQIRIAERFLLRPIATGSSLTMGDMPIATMRRADVKHILALYGDRSTGGHVLRLLKKLCLAALDLGWIEVDPTHRVKLRSRIVGHRAWTDDELAAYEARWPPGSRERLAYALALYTGQRRADLAAMRWTAYDGHGVAVVQSKTGSALWVPVHPALKEILDATERAGETILVTQWGRAFGVDGFGHMVADAIAAAGLKGCRLHGLRHTAGRCLAEAGATTKEIMAILGHKTLTEVARYTAGADQRKLAQDAIDTWAKPILRVINGGKK